MKKSIAENCIRYISTATALILALAMLCCANFSAGAKTLGSNLSITDASLLLADIDTTTNTTPAKTKDLIASGAGVNVLSVSADDYRYGDKQYLYIDMTNYSSYTFTGANFYYTTTEQGGGNYIGWCQVNTSVETNIIKIDLKNAHDDKGDFTNYKYIRGIKVVTSGATTFIACKAQDQTENCIKVNSDGTLTWTTYTEGGIDTPDPDPVVTDADLLSVLNGTKVMVYGGERTDWDNNPNYYFMTAAGTTDNPAAKVSLSKIYKIKETETEEVEYKFGVATLSTDIQYYQGHWASGLKGPIEAGGTYIVRNSTTATGFTQLANSGSNYLYSYDAGSTKTATTTIDAIDATVNVGNQLSVNTSTEPGISSLGLKNNFRYYLYNPNDTTYTEVSVTGGKVDTSALPVGTGYKLLTVLWDKNIYVLADTDTFSVVDPTPDLATGVTLTSVPETVEKNTSLTLTAELQNKHSSAGEVTYTFTQTTEFGGTFGSDTSIVTTSASSASVTFTPTVAGTYTFKVVATCDGYKSVETTVDVVVSDEVNYYITGRFNGHTWSHTHKDMQLVKVSTGLYKYKSNKTVAELSATIDDNDSDGHKPYFFIHTGSGKSAVWYGGSESNGHKFHENTEGNKFELTAQKKDTDTTLPTLLLFADTTATTKKDVVIWLDTRDSSHYKLWYEYTTPTKYSITYKEVENGTVSGPTEALANATVSVSDLKITPNKGYELDTLTFNDTAFTDSFTMPEQAVTVNATFKPIEYTITYYVDNIVTKLTPPSYNIKSPDITLPSPEPKDGYKFSGWHIGSTTGTLTEKILSGSTENKTFYGTYEPIEYTVTFDPDGGSVTPTFKKVAYNSTYGTLPTPTKENYSFVGWYLGDVKITSSSVYNTVGNVELKAIYAANPTISVTIKYNGVEDSSKATVTGDGQIEYNGSSTLVVEPADGYYIYNIEPQESYPYNVVKGEWTHEFTNLTEDVSIEITVKKNPTVNVEVYYGDVTTDKATVKINNVVQSSANIEYGDSAAFVVTPDSGYYISSVELTDYAYSPKSGEWTYTIQHVEEDKNIKVYLSDNPKVRVTCIDSKTENPITDRSVSATVNENPSTEEGISVEYGSNVALSASVVTANSYQFNGFYNSDKTTLLSSSANYTLNSVTADTEIFAKFDKLHKITIQWTNLDGLSLTIGEETTNLQDASSPYEKYFTEGSQFTLTTTIEVESEYKLNASCFLPSSLTGSYSTADSSNVTTKHYSCTVGSGDGTIKITPVPATYSGSGYWGDKVLKIDTTGVMKDSPNFSVLFSKEGSENTIEVRMVCTNSTNNIYECPIPNGYTSFVLKRRNPSKWSEEWNTASATLNGNTEFTASFGTGMVLAPKSGT